MKKEREMKKKMSIRTILFDLDGTLIDTNQLIHASFIHTFNQYNLSFTENEIMAFNGPPLAETFKKIDPMRAEEMIDTYCEHNHRVHDQYVKVFPKVVETLEQLKNLEVKMGVVTTKMKEGVQLGLAATDIGHYFDSIITLNDVKRPKPDPEPVLKAMGELDANAETTIMVGDNFHDIESGRNAGIKTAGVAWSQKGKQHLLAYNPTYMLEEMTDLLRYVEV